MYSWDGKDSNAELTESQRDSVFDLATFTENKLMHETVAPSGIIGDETDGKDSKTVNRKGVANNSQEIQIASQFYSWLAYLEDEMDKDTDAEIRNNIESLNDQRSKCSDILMEINNCLVQLGRLRSSYTEVSTKTNTLHEACEHLLSDQTALIDKAQCLEQSVSYFNCIDSIALKLDVPNIRLNQENYIQILNDLDSSYKHLQSHTDYREYGTYMTKLKNSMVRTLNLMRGNVYSLIDTAVQTVIDQKDNLTEEESFTYLYGKFRTTGTKVHMLMEIVEDRMEMTVEYNTFVLECYRYYLSRRETLLRPVIDRAVSQLATRHTRDHCSFLRSGLALLLHLCEDEKRLFAHFFSSTSSPDATRELALTLEGICASLYENFRPMLIHINHVETLAEMCTALQEELAQHEEGYSSLPAYASLCRGLLADVRERLVYRAHIYMRSQILSFSPSPGDLAYPDKLKMMLSISASTAAATPMSNSQKESSDESMFVNGGNSHGDLQISSGPSMPLSPADLHGMWYPTVRRTLVCLSKLSRCLDTTTFQGLSQECLSLCVQSLITAGGQISQSKTNVDGQLFLIKHLLILREQVAPFQLDFAVRETSLNFNKLKDAAYGLISAKSRIWQLNRSNAILKFLLDSTPDVMESVMDSKKEVDLHLKNTCDIFIQESVSKVTHRVSDFVQKVNSIETMNAKPDSPKVSLLDQPFAASARVQDLVGESTKLLRQSLVGLRESLHVYLYNPDLEYILYRPVRQGISKTFHELNNIINKYYSEEDRLIIACPTDEQLSLTMQG